MARRLTLVAGSGSLPTTVADAVRLRGDALQVLVLEGRNDIPGDKVLHTPLSNIRKLVAAVEEFRSTDVVMAGGAKISDLQRQQISRFLGRGVEVSDTSFSIMLGAYFSSHGVRPVGVDRFVPELLAPEGLIGGPKMRSGLVDSANEALRLARAVGRLDLGQAVVVAGGRPVAAEDATGTKALLERVGAIRASGLIGEAEPLIFAKALKPHQPKFIDLPAIGPETVESAAAAGIGVIVVEAGSTLVLERDLVREGARRHGISVYGGRIRRG